MQYLYLACLFFALGMLIWLKIFDVRNSVTQFVSLLIVVVANLGFYFVVTSTNITEAILAQKISYVGGIFLPTFYFFLVLEVCHIELRRRISIPLIAIQCVLYGFVCSIGHSELYYKSISSYMKNGVVVLVKEYGPLHTLYVVTMLGYLIASLIVATYTLLKKKSLNRRGVLFMVLFSAFAVAAYIAEKVTKIEYEFIPFVYDILMFGALIPVYDSNLYTVYANKDIINEQLSKVGFLTFNTKKIYKGCNNFMANVFPELNEYQFGEKIEGCSAELQALIDQISKLEELYKKNIRRKHVHTRFEPFLLNERHYSGMIHLVSNAYGKVKGYTIELTDDTEHYNALTLKERYNEELALEVDEKTKRIRIIQQKTILGMARMVESRDLSTGGHIKRTSDVVRIFAKKLLESDFGFDKGFLRLVIRSAPMHDLGKIGVDDAVLRKQGRFTDEEYSKMKKHSEIGYHMVSEILSEVEEPDFLRVAENVAHYHHEKIDGTGYPDGLKGDEIPAEARIMALADVFDALVSKRCYKEAFSYDKAFSIIEHDSGTHFDAELAKVFISCRPELEDYYNHSEE